PREPTGRERPRGRAAGHTVLRGRLAQPRGGGRRLRANATRRRRPQRRMAELRLLLPARGERERRPLDGARRGVDHLPPRPARRSGRPHPGDRRQRVVRPGEPVPRPALAGRRVRLGTAAHPRQRGRRETRAVRPRLPCRAAYPGARGALHRRDRGARMRAEDQTVASDLDELSPSRPWDDAPVLLALGAILLAAVWSVVLLTATPGDDSAEAGFARDMADHHAQAVEMAEIVRDRTADPEIRILATDIALTQQAQIGQMQGWLQAWDVPMAGTEPAMAWMGMPSSGPMPGMATREEVASLGALPEPEMDAAFLRLMIRHHQGGVMMAEGIVARTDRPEVLRLAGTVIAAQRAEISAMQQMLRDRGLPEVPRPGAGSTAQGGGGCGPAWRQHRSPPGPPGASPRSRAWRRARSSTPPSPPSTSPSRRPTACSSPPAPARWRSPRRGSWRGRHGRLRSSGLRSPSSCSSSTRRSGSSLRPAPTRPSRSIRS